MSTRLGQGFMAVAVVLFISGCTIRTYSQVKDRVDQGPSGNAGYIQGSQPPSGESQQKKTRKTYVLEFQALSPDEQRPPDINADTQERPANRMPSSSVSAPMPAVVSPAPSAPSVTESLATVEYAVQKDDTLQKISYKFYNTHRKWNKIYQANKERIVDPNRIKPGTILVIPDAKVTEQSY